jgi:hypothetical protein
MPNNTVGNPCPDVVLPPGAVEAGEWHNDGGMARRTIVGPKRTVARADVFTIGCQYVDGRFRSNASVRVESNPNDALSGAQARQLAAEILSAADDADAWA